MEVPRLMRLDPVESFEFPLSQYGSIIGLSAL
jgi:hypothetical protein